MSFAGRNDPSLLANDDEAATSTANTVDECDFDGVAVGFVVVVATDDSFATDCYVTALSKAEVVNLRTVL